MTITYLGKSLAYLTPEELDEAEVYLEKKVRETTLAKYTKVRGAIRAERRWRSVAEEYGTIEELVNGEPDPHGAVHQ